LPRKLWTGSGHSGHNWNQKGFTLLELLAALAIVSLCAAVLWPNIQVHDRLKLETAARGLADDLRLIRQAAITGGEFCRIEFYRYSHYYELRLPGEKRNVYLPEGVDFGSVPSFKGDPPNVHFNTLGHPSGGGTVTLKTKKGDRLYVIVTPVTGRVRISKEPPQHW
jgi:prepilin-type N-terminal cleavage/methylation domain-containing protein